MLSQGEGCLATNSVSHLFANCCCFGWTLPSRGKARPEAAWQPHQEGGQPLPMKPSWVPRAQAHPAWCHYHSLFLSQRAEPPQDPEMDPWRWLPSSLIAIIPTSAAKKSEARARAPSKHRGLSCWFTLVCPGTGRSGERGELHSVNTCWSGAHTHTHTHPTYTHVHMIPYRALWGSWAQDLSVSLIFSFNLIYLFVFGCAVSSLLHASFL